MSRTKGSKNGQTNKKNDIEESGEVKVVKRRGRQKGDKIEREPKVIWQLSKNFRIKMDNMNFTGQMKSNKNETTDDIQEDEDKGWKLLGHHSTNDEGLMRIFKDIVTEVMLTKARKDAPKDAKEVVINSEQFINYFEKSKKDTEKMFAPLKIKLVKKED